MTPPPFASLLYKQCCYPHSYTSPGPYAHAFISVGWQLLGHSVGTSLALLDNAKPLFKGVVPYEFPCCYIKRINITQNIKRLKKL